MNTIVPPSIGKPGLWRFAAWLRLAGLGALAGALASGLWTDRLVERGPTHGGTPLELFAAMLAVVGLWTGLALVIAGADLFRQFPAPPRALLP